MHSFLVVSMAKLGSSSSTQQTNTDEIKFLD